MSTQPTDDLHKAWQHAGAFDVYQKGRDPVAPALERLVQDPIAEYIPIGGTILEVGAGAGALRRYAGQVADRYDWVETDQNADFLALPRKHANTLLQLVLPNLTAFQSTPDAVVGLGVLDTLSSSTLESTAEATYEKLSTGGVVMHWLDMLPDYAIDIRMSAERGLFPVPYHGTNGQTGMHYLALGGLAEKVRQLPIDSSVKRAFLTLIIDPQKALPHVDRTAILPYLGRLAEENGLVAKSDQSWMDSLGHRCKSAWEAAGFMIVKNEVITATAIQRKRAVPLEYRDMAKISRRQGIIKTEADSKGKIPKGRIRVSADAHLFIAKKTS